MSHSVTIRSLGVRFLTALVLTLTVSTLSPASGAVTADVRPVAGNAQALATWSGWSEVPGNGFTKDAPEAISYHGRHYLFVRGTDDRIYLNRLTGNGWSGWSEVPGGGFTLSAPAASVYRGVLRLYVRGTDDRIYVNRYDDEQD